jgi:hypothetical protein
MAQNSTGPAIGMLEDLNTLTVRPTVRESVRHRAYGWCVRLSDDPADTAHAD